MAYTTIPSLASGDVLTATHMNILKNNIEYLYGLYSAYNTPFCGQTITSSGVTNIYHFRYVHRYLHYSATVTSGIGDDFKVYVNGNSEFHDGSNHSATYTYSGYIDLTAITAVPTLGDFIPVYIDILFSGSSELTIDYLICSPNTSL